MTIDMTAADLESFYAEPEIFLAQKIQVAEVSYRNLDEDDQALFNEAMSRELSQYLSQEAIRRCQSEAEEKSAWKDKRVMQARWVLTWKHIKEADQAEARSTSKSEGLSATRKDGTAKAKARLAILGFQHPDLGSPEYRTASPVVHPITRT